MPRFPHLLRRHAAAGALPLLLAVAAVPRTAAAQSAPEDGSLAAAVERGELATARTILAGLSKAARARPTTLYLAGRAAYDEQRYDDAVTALERAITAEPDRVAYQLWLARALMRQAPRASLLRRPGLIRRVRSRLERAHALEGANREVRLELLRLSLNAPAGLGGDRDRALRLAAALAPDRYFGPWAAAEVARKDGRADVAERELRRAIAALPDSIGAREALVALYVSEDRATEAAAASYEKGLAHRRRGHTGHARAAFQAAVRLDPAHAAARAALDAP